MTEGSTLSLKTQVEEPQRIYGLYFSVSFFGYNVEGELQGGQERIRRPQEGLRREQEGRDIAEGIE